MELLAPAGNWDAFKAAINNGADAVYIGGKQYSARQSAGNFDLLEIEKAILYARLRNRKVYVTVNTLIDNMEFEPVLDYLYQLSGIGADAIIMQDMGLLHAARTILPEVKIHASTQMTVHNQSGAELLQKIGVERIVLARELTAAEIDIIHHALPNMQLEVFIHGALCYSYSGQCLLSSIIGGRSGNRGRCAQPCRLPYDLYRDGDKVNLPGLGRYLLSPADLCLIDHLPRLEAIGVSSLKIEGRMRRAEYVAVVTRIYREVLDQLQQNPGYLPEAETKERLRKIFNRNFTAGYFSMDDQFMSTISPKNMGIMVGRVEKQTKPSFVRIKLNDSVSEGDGLAIWTGPDRVEALTVGEMKIDGKKVGQACAGQIIEIKHEGRVQFSNLVFKTHDKQVLGEAQRSYGDVSTQDIPVDAEVILADGEKLRLILQSQGRQVEATTTHSLKLADKQPLNEEILRQKIGRLGNTPFFLDNLTMSGDRNLMIPLSDLNDVRRRAIGDLENSILLGSSILETYDDFQHAKQHFLCDYTQPASPSQPLLTVTVSTIEQAIKACENGADRIYIALDGLCTGKRVNMIELKKAGAEMAIEPDRLIPMLPRIHKPLEHFDYRKRVATGVNSIMISSWADVEWALECDFSVTTDYNMNVFNQYTHRYLTSRGVEMVCLSPELTMKQLAQYPDLSQVELVVHGELIIMLSQYCILGQTRTPGKHGCTNPCRQGSYSLGDRRGYSFPIETDSDCHLYLFNSRILCMMEDLRRIMALKPAALRIEARRSGLEEIGFVVSTYREVIDSLISGHHTDLRKYHQQLQDAVPNPFTKGHYYRGVL